MDARGKQRHPTTQNHEPAPLGERGPSVKQMSNRPPISAHRTEDLFWGCGRVRAAQVLDSELDCVERHRSNIGSADALGKFERFCLIIGRFDGRGGPRPCRPSWLRGVQKHVRSPSRLADSPLLPGGRLQLRYGEPKCGGQPAQGLFVGNASSLKTVDRLPAIRLGATWRRCRGYRGPNPADPHGGWSSGASRKPLRVQLVLFPTASDYSLSMNRGTAPICTHRTSEGSSRGRARHHSAWRLRRNGQARRRTGLRCRSPDRRSRPRTWQTLCSTGSDSICSRRCGWRVFAPGVCVSAWIA